MSEKHGIEETKKLLEVVIELGNVLDKVLTEQGGMVTKIKHTLELSDELFKLAGFSASKFRLEFAELSRSERDELVDHFKDKFDLSNDFLETVIEQLLEASIQGFEIGGKIISLVKDYKAQAVKKPRKKKA